MNMRIDDMFRIPRLYQSKKYPVHRGTNQQAGLLKLNRVALNIVHKRNHRRVDFRRFIRCQKPKYKFNKCCIVDNL